MLQIPVTAIITVVIGLSVLLAAVKIERTSQGSPPLAKRTGSVATLGERLLGQYAGGALSVESMLTTMQLEFGDSGPERLLKIVDAALFIRHDLKLDRLYCLRGLILRHMGQENEAAGAFRLALKNNPESMDARMSLVIHYMKGKMFGSARVEIEKVLKANDAKYVHKTIGSDISDAA